MPLDLTRVFSLTFSTFFKNLPRLLLIAVIVFSPILLMGGLYIAIVGPGRMSAPLTALIVSLDLLLLHHLLSAALVEGIGQDLKGEKLSIRRSLQKAFRHAVPAIGLGVIMVVGLGLSFALLFIPGVILLCIWCAAFPAMMEEKLGPIAALKRSAKLTKGSRLPIFSVLIILLLAMYTGFSFTMVPLTIVFERGGGGPVIFFVAQILMLFARSIIAVLSAVIYHELRVGGEGLEVKQLGSVFD